MSNGKLLTFGRFYGKPTGLFMAFIDVSFAFLNIVDFFHVRELSSMNLIAGIILWKVVSDNITKL